MLSAPTESVSVFDAPVVVVGAGVAGLVSAHLLAEAGADVVVIEKLPMVGGLARSFVYDKQFVFDCGPHRFDTSNEHVKTYLDRLLGDNGTFFPRKSEVYFKGQYYGWPIKPQNLLQLPRDVAARAFLDLTLNGFKHYGEMSFEDYILRQYGPTLYEHFFLGYTHKFLGVHPRDTHSDWAKVGINRAILDDQAQMQNLAQLLKSTLLQFDKKSQHFLYPTQGMHQAWTSLAAQIRGLGGRIITGQGARLEGQNGHVDAVWAGDERFKPSAVVWTAPITLACQQLQLPVPRLDYLGLLLFNVMVAEDCPRDYQWCYYGAADLLINRVSIPRFFSPATAPTGMTGYCCEVSCMEGDQRWLEGERLTDWVLDDLLKVGLVPNRHRVQDVRVERVGDSYPIYRTGYPGQLDSARRSLAAFHNLHLAGRTGLFWYNNMDHSIENAMQLTTRLLRESGVPEAPQASLAAGA
ncbi:MAG: NAD(P)-binding protein [Oligoflexia bacterium]|nr:NAD(P)-binding protein [Oligoflexia bacterium]